MAHANIIFLGVLVLAALAKATRRVGDDLDHDLSVVRKCNTSSPVDRDFMNTVLINRVLLDQNNYGFKCFLHCVYTEYGWMNHHGDFRLEVIKKFLRESHLPIRTVRKLLTVCTDSESKDKCERAFSYTQCFWEELKKPQWDDPEEDFFLLQDYERLGRSRDDDEYNREAADLSR